MESSFVETKSGKPISMTAVKKLGATPTTDTYTFSDDGSIKLDSVTSGQHTKSTLPKPEGAWLTPAAADTYFRERFKAGAKEIKVRSIDPIGGAAPVLVTSTSFEKTTLTINGHAIDAVKMNIINSMEPTPTTQYVDADGEVIRTEADMGILKVLMTATTREKALEKSPAPEIMVNTFVKPDKPIKDPHAPRNSSSSPASPAATSHLSPTPAPRRSSPSPPPPPASPSPLPPPPRPR